jgi:hypothetical protein
MPLVLIVPAFVAAAMYLRRHFGGGALAALWAFTSAVMAFTNGARFMELVGRRVGTSISDIRALGMAFMLYLMAVTLTFSANLSPSRGLSASRSTDNSGVRS